MKIGKSQIIWVLPRLTDVNHLQQICEYRWTVVRPSADGRWRWLRILDNPGSWLGQKRQNGPREWRQHEWFGRRGNYEIPGVGHQCVQLRNWNHRYGSRGADVQPGISMHLKLRQYRLFHKVTLPFGCAFCGLPKKLFFAGKTMQRQLKRLALGAVAKMIPRNLKKKIFHPWWELFLMMLKMLEIAETNMQAIRPLMSFPQATGETIWK